MENNYSAITKKYDTPIYIYDEKTIVGQCKKLARHFPSIHMHYACKANSNPALLRIIREQGVGIETVSMGEVDIAVTAGFSKDNISFTGSNLTEKELRYGAKNAGRVHLDSLTQLETWGRLRLGRQVSLRLNQGMGAGHHKHVITGGPESKFGITLKDIPRAKKIARAYGLTIAGIQQHIGSNVLDGSIVIKAMKKLLETSTLFPDVTHIDFGGGLGIPYAPDEKQLDLKTLGEICRALLTDFSNRHGGEITFAMEPGRFIVAEAGVLLVSVVDMKSTEARQFVGVNSGFNHLIRPAMYGAYHPIENTSRKSGKRAKVTVAGNICESGDVFAVDRAMPVPQIDDTLAIRNAGAYGMSMASNYNMRAVPKEVLIRQDGSTKNISYDPKEFAR